ncbi:NAD-glutamate dehydrogenase [Kribbella flavida DSM 17836]|uniref:NAD-glutamate dehydrogenase n=1 Tax=Kribbella flavida (strain DSM 17836 / JCM 10339 / NBRC 14399) TaxID=479435 RepID=D2PMN3_KRIFD|nr:NAD-glutamate dehydrogenase [Kribbella flavida]ADB30777.1 NAD-glutamate dehydrogenase [Kribbella flavida DSM 17836]
MQSKLDVQKADVLAKAVAAGSQGHDRSVDAGKLKSFLERYYRYVAAEDVAERQPQDCLGAAKHHYKSATSRPQGTAKVHVFTPTLEEHGWSANGRTVVEIVVDDMPFLVDSAAMVITDHGLELQLLIHPQFVVRRDVAGTLREVLDDTTSADGHDLVRESWMHLEVERIADPAEHRALESALLRVLGDVREAVEDWPKMHEKAVGIAAALEDAELPVSATEAEEARELLEWLADEHFTFLGYREYAFTMRGEQGILRGVPGTGLGILRQDPKQDENTGLLPPEVSAKAREKKLLILTKANSRSTVHRSAYLDYVGLKSFDENGEPVGERRFIGLLSSTAYTESVMQIPVLRRKALELFKLTGFEANSHSGKGLLDVLETYPRDELLQAPVEDLLPIVQTVLHLQERRAVKLFVRRDVYNRYLSCLVYLPRDRYTTAVRLKMQQILKDAIGADSVDYAAHVTESVLARVHFVVRMKQGQTVGEYDADLLEQRVVEATRAWQDDFAVALHALGGDGAVTRLNSRYAGAFPEAYKEDFDARVAVKDVMILDRLPAEDGLAMSLYTPIDEEWPGERRFKVYRTGSALSLSQVLPHLTHMGVEVIDERPYEIRRPDVTAYIYDFGLRAPADQEEREDLRTLFSDTFRAVWEGRAESDRLNALVLRGNLSWRQVSILRAYQRYIRQGGTPFSQDYIENTFLNHVDVANLLVQLFEACFDPARGPVDDPVRRQTIEQLEKEISAALDTVKSLDEDRILRSYLTVIKATLRTNYYQPGPDGEPRGYISFKLEPKAIPELPQPRPAYEIFVYSPQVEGVHLRFGAVARGGLRWSDRREDFRTEVLGLVKAQMVKNSVIVPVGAKGGFYAKQLPDPAVDREAWLAEGVASYRTFISGLLDITDNIVAGEIVPPRDVVRYDGDDAYLVVAADKGTATFSDIANSVAKEYGFWLGDAFASGGSVGYDHKAMGITARGAWESVKRHFREMGHDCQSEDFTVVGVGDMSGDVFGNGMLLSEHIRLVAAFDHRHIFLDPSPDAATSFAERRRLFELPRSSWADYDSALISAGGGVYPRTDKAISISPEVREVLGIEGAPATLTPAELMQAIIKAPVDLFWNGGIGTYVKAAAETHADVGDKANDAIRINGADLRAKAVGEGGNLGFTQLGRIEYAAKGGRINTDFIDNVAGVDTSDHEVNIKILLDKVVADGDLTEKQRNDVIASMTDEVAALVLKSNYRQNIGLANATAQAAALMHVHQDWVRRLEKQGLLDRELEFLPSVAEFKRRKAEGRGLTSPELSVLIAYTKIVLEAELLKTSLPDDDFLAHKLVSYFPQAIQDRFAEPMKSHQLRREIITTQVVNEFVNSSGITAFHRLSLETGGSVEDVVRANLAASRIFAQPDLLALNADLDNVVDADTQTRMRLETRTLVERATRWLVSNRRPPMDIAELIEFFTPGISKLTAALPDVLRGRELALFEQRRETLVTQGVPADFATRIAVLPPAYAGLGIVETADRDDLDVLEVAKVHFALGERLQLGRFLERIVGLPRTDRWQTMARAALRDDLHAVHARLTAQVLATTDTTADPEDRVIAWQDTNETALGRAASMMEEIVETEGPELAHLSVGLRLVRTLLDNQA